MLRQSAAWDCAGHVLVENLAPICNMWCLLFAVGDERFLASVRNEERLRCVKTVGFL